MFDFTAFDVETANEHRDSICSIGVVRYENGNIVFSKSYLVNPETYFRPINISVHGIHSCDVANAPTFPCVWQEINKYFQNTVLVAHNAKAMDLCALYKTLERYDIPPVTNQYVCTFELAKGFLCGQEGLHSYTLPDVSTYLEVELSHHHDALDDTLACMGILLKLYDRYSLDIEPKEYFGPSRWNCSCGEQTNHYSNKTMQMQELQKIVESVIADGVITNDEITGLERWLNNHCELRGFYPFDKIADTVEAIMYDGVLDIDEQRNLLKLLDAFINPQTEHCPIDVCGKTICLSGEFQHGPKLIVEQLLVEKGATVVQTVTAKVDILILGEVGSEAWKYGKYGSKYEKARQMQQKGKNIRIVKENDILHNL